MAVMRAEYRLSGDKRPYARAQVIIVALNIVGTLYGLPLSGTHISIACLIGAGLATNTEIDYKVCRNIILYWLITLPGAAL